MKTKYLDNLWSMAVKIKANYRCEVCGNNKVESHHIIGRDNKAVRWKINNGVCLCTDHHTANEKFSAHKTPNAFRLWVNLKKGKDYMDELESQANKICKFDNTVEAYEELKTYIEKE